MHRLLSSLVIVLLLAPLALTAHAEEEKPAVPAEKKPAEKLVLPGYSAEDMICQTTDLPRGWTRCPPDETLPAVVVTEDALMMLGLGTGYDEDTLFVESRALRNEGQIATIAIVDVDASPAGFRKALTAKAETNHWHVKELGSPMRLLVVWGSSEPTAKSMLAWQHGLAVQRLAEAAWLRILERSVDGWDKAQQLLAGARAIEPRAGVIGAVQGFLLQRQAPAKALAEWRHALAPDVVAPPRGKLRVQVAFEAAQAMLTAKSEGTLEGDVYPEVAAMLKEAIGNERLLDLTRGGREAFMAFGNRYNLACTYARMGKVEEALEVLHDTWVFARKHLAADGYAQAYNHMVRTDPDMEPLKATEGYKQLLATFDPAKGAGG